MQSFEDFSNQKDVISTLIDEKVLFYEPTYSGDLIDINGDFNLYSKKSKSIEKLIKKNKLTIKLGTVSGNFLFDLRYTNKKIHSLENFPKRIKGLCRLSQINIFRFSNIEEVDGDLSIDHFECLRGLVDAPIVKGSIRITSCPNVPNIEKSFYRDRKNQFPKENYYKEFLNWIVLNKRYDDLSINQVVWPNEYLKIIQDPNFKNSIQGLKKFNL